MSRRELYGEAHALIERAEELLMEARIRHQAARNKQIVADRIAGMTYQAMGDKYGLTREMCRHICKQAHKRGEITLEQLRVIASFGKPYGWRSPHSRILNEVEHP